MEIDAVAESGDESLDSIPRPEYEAIEVGAASTHSSLVADSLCAKEMEGITPISDVKSWSGMDYEAGDVHSEDTISEVKTEITAQDLNDLDISDEKVNDHERKNVSETYSEAFENEIEHKLTQQNIIAIESMQTESTLAPNPHKLVQAKTKDNKFLLVQLVDENGKTLNPPVRNVSQINKPDVPAGMPARSSTPMSREFLALQKSVNESKILTEFVTDTNVEKARKRKTVPPSKESIKMSVDLKDNSKIQRKSNSSIGVNAAEHVTADSEILEKQEKAVESLNFVIKQSAEQQKAVINMPSKNVLTLTATSVQKHSAEKSRKIANSKFVPLKDDASSYQSDSSVSSKRRSRSKSLSRKISANADVNAMSGKLKRWPSEEKSLKRTNMRSQNSEFVQKQMEFLHRVIGQEEENIDDDDDANDVNEQEEEQRSTSLTGEGDDIEAQLAASANCSMNDSVKNFLGNFRANASDTQQSSMLGDGNTKSMEKYLESIYQIPPKRGWDSFCWKCRQCFELLACSKCLRSFHPSCIKITAATKLDKTWACPECIAVENVLNGPKRSRRNELSLDMLSQLLSFALKRMRNVKGLAQFEQSYKQITSSSKFFVNPVSFETLQEKIENKSYRCAEEFVNETKWMQHNTLIASGGTNSKDTITAKAILKICRQEANEIDTCPECYLNANLRTDWFLDVCPQPHLLLWAKLKGFPYWPAKAMGLGQGSHVNVRFFGQHDRAFVPSKDCYLFSEQVPNAATGKRSARAGFAECIQEVEVHIEKIRAKVGSFKYAPYKTLYDPAMELQQLELMMPGVQEYMKRQQLSSPAKPPLQYKIVKTADNHLSIIKKGTSTADSGTDSDHSLGIASTVVDTVTPSPEKKKKSTEHLQLVPEIDKNVKLPVTLAETSKSIKIPTTTSDYEVVSKLTIDENNSSKVSTVILKRKAENAQHRKDTDNGGEDMELPLPKMTKIENNPEEELNDEHVVEGQAATPNNEENTKLESSEHLKKKLSPPKQSKVEPKVPVLTIKTNSNKLEESKAPNEVCNKGNESVPKPQNAVENLVKYKQGVTIKKITKEDPKKKTANETNTSERPTVAKKDAAVVHQEKSKEQFEKPQHATKKENKQKHELIQKQKTIIKDLVPFVEIKKENASDDEAALGEKDKPLITTLAEASTTVKSVVVGTANNVAPSDNMQPASTHQVNTPTQPLAEPMSNTTLLDSVKQEQMSDDDEEVSTLLTVLNEENEAPMQAVKKGPVSVAAVISAVVPPAAIEAVRVVGETTIQRVSVKMATTTSCFGNQSNANQTRNSPPVSAATPIPQTGAIFTGLPQMSATTTTSTNNSKRNTLRGIPYGPLPASATPTVRALTNFEHVNIQSTSLDKHQQQQPQVQLLPQAQQQPQAQQLPQQLQQHKMQRPEQQRARKSFPNRSPTEVSPVRGAVVTPPISPAAAVVNIADSKRALTKTSMVSIPVDVATSRCNITAGIPVPPLTAVTKIMPTTVTTTTTAAAPINTFINCNGSTQIAMSAPPPLAGLSYSTFTSSSSTTLTSTSSVQLLNGGVQPSLSDSPVAGNSNIQNTEPHLLGDFVTPTLASAITEVICRGPPRMTPRPNGPLQSDGSTMFPSQAGPVCRTLVENAHKLTDFFISVMEDTMSEMSVSEEPVLQAKITLLTMELERTKQTYEREITELKRTSDLMLCEMRKSMESEKNRIAAEVRKQCELERKRCVEETKKKQWCANCGRESQFHCCWNTSYCDYPCQQLHWSRHASSCAQTRPLSNDPALQSTSGSAATPMERHHASNKSFATITSTSSGHYNNKTVVNTKRDKTSAKSASNNAVNQLTNTAAVTPAEVLKLPSNTYLRPVTNSSSVRTPYPQQAPVQRFNIPLPIAAPANPGLPYTLVQREGNWELMSALTHTGTSTNSTALATNTCQATTINQQQQQQTRLLSNPNTMSTKSASRNRSGNTTALNSNLSGSTHRSGAHL